MRAWAATFVTAVAVTGCNYGASEFSCKSDVQCGAGGRCEVNSLCSFADPSCMPSGRRYGALGGANSGSCVGDTGSSGPDSGGNSDASIQADAAPDSPPDARVCFGVMYPICLAAAPSTPLAITTDTAINTDSTDPAVCAAVMPGGGGDHYCVVVGTTIDISGAIRATGSKPLVLLAVTSITTSKTIDVGSHRIVDGNIDDVGAGADPAVCTTDAGTGPKAGGGGAGGSFAGLGGNGAMSSNNNSTGGTPGATAAAAEVRGGCRGQAGDGSSPGAGGHGGGAIYLIAGGTITLGGAITAGGEGGQAGQTNISGAGGGGAGGMIALDAPTVTTTGNPLLLANGGAGAEGSGRTSAGDAGEDATRAAAAKGGSTPQFTNAGDGGDGSATDEKGPGKTGAPGVMVAGNGGGGGGGGGGAGLIRAPAGSTLGNQLSPKASN